VSDVGSLNRNACMQSRLCNEAKDCGKTSVCTYVECTKRAMILSVLGENYDRSGK
jgi:hypothetical protein